MVFLNGVNADDYKGTYIHNAVRLIKYLIKYQVLFYFSFMRSEIGGYDEERETD